MMSIKKEGNIDPKADQEKIFAAIRRELKMIGLQIEKTAVEYLDRKNINVDGTLRDSITSKVSRQVNSILLQVGANAKYAVYVEEGTRPHWPPHDPIVRWVVKKLNIHGPPAQKVAYAVQYKIAHKGTKARPFLEVAFRAHRNKIAGRIARAIEKEASTSSASGKK